MHCCKTSPYTFEAHLTTWFSCYKVTVLSHTHIGDSKYSPIAGNSLPSCLIRLERKRCCILIILTRRYRVMHIHDDVIKWKHFSRYWLFVRRIHLSAVNSPHKDQRRRAFMFSFICAWTNSWVNKVNNRDAGDLKRHRNHYDVTVLMRQLSRPSRQVMACGLFGAKLLSVNIELK